MSFIKLDRLNFPTIINSDWDISKDYFPISMDILGEHPLFDELLKIVNAVSANIEIDESNVFCLKAISGIPETLYGFSLLNVDNKPIIQFGNDGANKVPVVSTTKEEDGEIITVFKAGNAFIKFSEFNGKPIASLKFGKTEISCYVKLKDDQVNFNQLDRCETIEELSLLIGSIGKFAVKLVDFVRPYISQGIRGKLPKPLEIEVLSWSEPTGKEFNGRMVYSVMLDIFYDGVVELANGDIMKFPKAMWLNDNQTSYGLLMSAEWCQRAFEEKRKGGKILLLIASMHSREPEKIAPPNILRIVPGNKVETKQLTPAKTEIVTEQQARESILPVVNGQVDKQAAELLDKF